MNFIPQGSKKENYIDLKVQIQEDINILNNSKDKEKRNSIVIIVDDFDRIDKDKPEDGQLKKGYSLLEGYERFH